MGHNEGQVRVAQPLQRGRDIAERLLAFGLAALDLVERLPRRPAARHVALQLFRSATGSGSNYDEARAAESRIDFAHKLAIAAKEARESCYWLTLIDRSGWLQRDIGPLVQEANELAAILAASVRTARSREASRPPAPLPL
jgi:four helix bundle protein